MNSQLFFSLFILITFCLNDQVLSSPGLIWSNVNLPESDVPLSKLSSINLISDYICKLSATQIQLRLFGVNDLTIEDIQQGPQRNHPLLLDAKKSKTNFHYFPSVGDDAYNAFLLIPRSNNMKCSQKHFEITSSKTYEELSDALNIMQATIDNVDIDEDNTVVIALFNSTSNSQKLSRRRRQTNETERVLVSNNNTCMFYAEQLRWNNVNGSKATGQNYSLNFAQSSCTSSQTSNRNYSSVTLDLVWDNDNTQADTIKMSLITTIIGRYWYLENVTLNNTEYRYFAYGMYDQMTTPPGYSYVCTTGTFVRYNSTVLHGQYNFTDKFYLLNLQFQPFNVKQLTFGPPNYCSSFFTSGIWMGITSSLLCLAILLFGIHRIMSIKSNDRFDDPKGKPLIIKAQE